MKESSIQRQVQDDQDTPKGSSTSSASAFGQALAGLLILLISVAVGYIGWGKDHWVI